MRWTKAEINHIRVSLDRCSAQELADELGMAKESVKKKIQEIKADQRLAKLSQYVRKVK